MKPKDHQFPNGLTVKELKTIVADWPEVDHLGEPTEVWIETGYCPNSVLLPTGGLDREN